MALPMMATVSLLDAPRRRYHHHNRSLHHLVATTTTMTMALLLLLLCFVPHSAQAMKQHWHFHHEDRPEFLVERFGFAPLSTMEIQVKDVSFSYTSGSANTPSANEIQAGLLVIHESKLWDTIADLENLHDDNGDATAPAPAPAGCLLRRNHTAQQRGLYIDLTDQQTWSLSQTVGEEQDNDQAAKPMPGFYYVFFSQCTDGLQVSFEMDANFQNPNGNFLSAGDAALPSVYLWMSVAFLSATVAWVRFLRKNLHHIHHIHHMMTMLVFVKTISLFTESMRFQYMKQHGDTLTSWNVVFYVVMCLKGIFVFMVLLLIGTGWSLVQPHLSKKDKSILSIVLLLQIISNIAMVSMEESEIGSRNFVTWRDLLHFMDLLCCCAILFPIVGSIKKLRESAFIDGKAHLNLQKLIQFRSFYLIVVSYLYVTRIALFLVASALPYTWTFVSVCIGEGASLVFFLLIGYRFRPVDQNPYLEVATSSSINIDSLEEFGFDQDDDEDEVHGVPIQRKDHLRLSVRPPSPRKIQQPSSAMAPPRQQQQKQQKQRVAL